MYSFYRRARLFGLRDKILIHLVNNRSVEYKGVCRRRNLHDKKIGYAVAGLSTFSYPTLQKICVDGGFFVYAETVIKLSHIHTLLNLL